MPIWVTLCKMAKITLLSKHMNKKMKGGIFMSDQYESPVVIDYEEGNGATTYGVIVLPLIAVAVYSTLVGVIVAAAATVPAVLAAPYPGYE